MYEPSPDRNDLDSGEPTVSVEGHRAVVWLEGEHDITTTGLIGTALVRAVARSDGDVVVDLAGVTFMDASTVGVLLRGRELCRIRGRTLTVRSPQSFQRRLLEMCEQSDLIEDRPTDGGRGRRPARTALESWVEIPPESPTIDEPADREPAGREHSTAPDPPPIHPLMNLHTTTAWATATPP